MSQSQQYFSRLFSSGALCPLCYSLSSQQQLHYWLEIIAFHFLENLDYLDGIKEPRLFDICEEEKEMRIMSRDILGEVFAFQGWQTHFCTFSVVESCQLQCDKKNVIKISGKTSLIPVIFP